MSNTLNEQLAAISWEFFSQGGLDFTFSAVHVWLRQQIDPYRLSWLYQYLI